MQQINVGEIKIEVGQRYNARNPNDERYAVVINTGPIIYYEMFENNGRNLGKDWSPVDIFLKWGTLFQSTSIEGAIKELCVGDTLKPKQKCSCNHPNKKIVPMLNKSFWYCPDCKSDLGDA